VEGRLTGMLAVTQSTPGRHWSEKDIQVLSIVASSSAGVIEQARLRAEAMDKQRLEEESRRMMSELHVAREIQMGMLPESPLTCGPWRVCGQVIPERQVGGDGYDHRTLGENRFGFAIADVAGKGAPAALLMSNLLASLHAFCNGRVPVTEAVRNVNRSVCRWVASDRFITLFYGEVDLDRGVLTYTNAGHNLPLLRRRDGVMFELTEGGPPLGLLPDTNYAQGQVPIALGDSLLAYSDGISDAQNPRGETFGEERLRQLWSHLGGWPRRWRWRSSSPSWPPSAATPPRPTT
jgi:sigma-B regulation protein RsbU (phosphoserine phosphatase)